MTKFSQSTTAKRPTARALMLFAAVIALAWGAAGTSQAATRTDIKEIVIEEAMATTVPPSLALAVAKVESDFRARALSSAGARGVMQIMPATAKGEFGVAADELWDARLNVQLGIEFLAQLIRRYDGRWDLALSHYNSGRIKRSGGRAEPLPATRKYVASVLRWERRYAAQAKVWRVKRTPRPSWQPARTRIARMDRPVPRRTAVARVLPKHSAADAFRGRFNGLDDFSGSLEQRRQRVRHLLDDFTKRKAPTEG